jgi:tetratricopeptide (TPR) repeat protein
MAYLPRVPRAWSPYNSRGAAGIRFFGSHVIWLRDTSYARTVAQLLDSLATASRQSGNDDLAMPLHASEIYLALGDSVNALRATRTFTDSTLTVLARTATSNDAWEWPYLLAPRMMKQRGDLAARMGYPEEARAWYERLLRLWSDADPEFKPEVDRVRAALAATVTKR